ncbi:MAG TPA: hypothetical protein VF831_06120 [Anaerolineales bacterium]
MLEQTLLLKLSSPGIIDDTTSWLRQEYRAYQSLFQAQPVKVQQHLGTQAARLAEAVVGGITRVSFTLPETVTLVSQIETSNDVVSVPAEHRAQSAGGWLARLTHTSLLTEVTQRLTELEGSSDQAMSVSAGLLRYATAFQMVYNMLPAGKTVTYASVEGDDIPNQPVEHASDPGNAIRSRSAAPVSGGMAEVTREQLMVPYADARSDFYLPQWVAFDEHGELLASSINEAEACISSLQHYLVILQSAITIAPYMIADELWQQKRYGALGQLVNQGRALANYKVHEIIHEINRRAEMHKLDRGLRLFLPYFDDQKLTVEKYDFTVVPTGWVMFVPAFVVLAAREQQLKVAGDSRLSFATRKHLLDELEILEKTFLR